MIEYNTERLHSAIGYITPHDKLEGRTDAIFAARQKKLQSAAKARIETYESRQEACPPHESKLPVLQRERGQEMLSVKRPLTS